MVKVRSENLVESKLFLQLVHFKIVFEVFQYLIMLIFLGLGLLLTKKELFKSN